MIATDMLALMIPKIYELMFMDDPDNKGQPLLTRLMGYFNTTPNYTLSGYVVRIMMNLIPANPSRVI